MYGGEISGSLIFSDVLILQVASGKGNKQSVSFNEAESRIKILQAELEGLKRELAAKDKIIELLEKQIKDNR